MIRKVRTSFIRIPLCPSVHKYYVIYSPTVRVYKRGESIDTHVSPMSQNSS